MELTGYLVLLSLIWLASLALVSLFNLKVIRPALESLKMSLDLQLKQDKQRDRALSQALNLLASKDPIAYQMLQASTPEAAPLGEYNGPYMTGEEYQLLLQDQARQDQLWKDLELNNGD